MILFGLLLAQMTQASETPLPPDAQQRLATLKAGYDDPET